MERKRKSNRIERWLREIGDSDRFAAPLDFADVTGLSRHSCLCDRCPLRSVGTTTTTTTTTAATPATLLLMSAAPPGDGANLERGCGPAVVSHVTVAPQVSSQEPPVRIVKQPTSDSLPTTGSSSSSGSLDFTSTESNTEMKQSSASSLASSLDSNKMKVVRREQQQQQQQQHQQRSRHSCHGASGDNRVDAAAAAAAAGTAGAATGAGAAGAGAGPPQALPSASSSQPQPPPPQPLPPPHPHQQQQPEQEQQQRRRPESPLQTSVAVAQPVTAGKEAGITYYFHLTRAASPAACGSGSREHQHQHQHQHQHKHQQLLTLMRTLRDSDPALAQISAARGVAICLGREIEPVSSASASGYRRKVVISGASWRSVMDAVNDISLAYPDLMSSPLLTPASTATVGGTSGQQQQQQHGAASPPKQGRPPTDQCKPHSLHQHKHQQHQPHQHQNQAHQQSHQHQQKSVHQSASSSLTVVGGCGTGHSHQHQQHQPQKQQQHQPQPQKSQEQTPPQIQAKASKPKLAQNVRFQLTTQQRESLFTQDESGRPTHPRLKQLLSTLRMELIFLERSINQDSVPSVKVRFFFEGFDQLTAFCKAIDYQIPSQS